MEEVGNGTGSGSGEDEPIAARTRKRSSPDRWEGYCDLNDLASLYSLESVKKRRNEIFSSLTLLISDNFSTIFI